MREAGLRAVVFDLGGVLIDWNPRHRHRMLFDGDAEAMERFLATVCATAWNEEQDGGRPVTTPSNDGVPIMPSRRPVPGQTAVRPSRFAK